MTSPIVVLGASLLYGFYVRVGRRIARSIVGRWANHHTRMSNVSGQRANCLAGVRRIVRRRSSRLIAAAW